MPRDQRRRRSCFEITREEQRRRRLAKRRAEEDAVAIVDKMEGFMSVLMSVLAWSLMPAWMNGGARTYPLTSLPPPRQTPVDVDSVSAAPTSSAAPLAPEELAWTNIHSGLRAIWSGNAAANLVELRWRQIKEHCPDIMTEIARISDATKQEREAMLLEMRRIRHNQSAAAAARAMVIRLRREKAARAAEDAVVAPPTPQNTHDATSETSHMSGYGVDEEEDNEPKPTM